MDKCKLKAIQTNLCTFRHNQTYSGFIQAYSGIFRTLWWYIQNPDIFRTPAYSQHWNIQNPAIFRTLAYSKSEAYSGPCHTSAMKYIFTAIIIFTNYDYFRKACPVEIVVLCKKLCRARGPGTVNFLYTYWYIQIN